MVSMLITIVLTIAFLILMATLGLNLLAIIYSYVSVPFRAIHQFMTRTRRSPRNPNINEEGKVQYCNWFNFIVFGIFGNILYYIFFFGLILNILFSKTIYGMPHSYAVHSLHYEVGDTVYSEKTGVGTVEEAFRGENSYGTFSDYCVIDGTQVDGKDIYLVKEKPKGLLSDLYLVDSAVGDISYHVATKFQEVRYKFKYYGGMIKKEIDEQTTE